MKEGAKILMKQMDTPKGPCHSFISAVKRRKTDPADFIEDGAFFQTGYLSLLSQEPAHDGRITTLAKGGIQYGERSFWRKETTETVAVSSFHLGCAKYGRAQMETVLFPACPEGRLLFPVDEKALHVVHRCHVFQGSLPGNVGKGEGRCSFSCLIPHRTAVVSNSGHSCVHGRLKSLPNSTGVNFTMVGRPWGHTKGRDV